VEAKLRLGTAARSYASHRKKRSIQFRSDLVDGRSFPFHHSSSSKACKWTFLVIKNYIHI